MARDLIGVMQREKAKIGAFITMNPPTQPMKKEAASAGFYQPKRLHEANVPRLQILTIEELLSGKAIAYPAAHLNVAIKTPSCCFCSPSHTPISPLRRFSTMPLGGRNHPPD